MSIFYPQNPGIGGLDELTIDEELLVQNLASLSYAQGDILYFDGSNLNRLPAGDSGKFLRTNGSSANPSWETISASVATLNDVGDVTITTASAGHIVLRNSGNTTWVNVAVSGDATIATTGALTIANDAITTVKVLNSNITLAKIQNIATSRVLGRITASSGVVEELTGENIRTITGLATSDSPQFAGIELGHANDTTLTRVSAGVVAIEGVNIVKEGAITTSGLTQATARLLGRTTSGTGSVEEISVGTSMSLSSGSLNTIQDIRTSASPQFNSIELGHASDTTITRVSAGVIAVEGIEVATISATQTLTNKTLTAPKIANGGFIADANGNEQMIFTTTASAVNEIEIKNAATGNAPEINASGETNVDLKISGKGTGKVKINSSFGDITSNSDGATITFNLATSNKHTVTLGGNRTLALSNPAVGQVFMISLVQDGTGSRTVTWFTTIRWAGGSAPTLTTTANKRDTFGFICTGSGTYDGFIIGQNI